MSRSIESRLRKLEARIGTDSSSLRLRPSQRVHLIPARTPEEGDAETAKLIAEGASPDDLFVRMVPFSATRWDEATGRWVDNNGSSEEPRALD